MKAPITADNLDRELRKAAIACFVIAAAYVPTIPYFYFVRRGFRERLQGNYPVNAEIVRGIIDSMQIIFFATLPAFCLILALIGSSLLKNYSCRRRMADEFRNKQADRT